MNCLRDEGYQPAGRMVLIPDGVRRTAKQPDIPGTYAFTLDGCVAYIGKAASLLHRVGSYAYDFDVHTCGIRRVHVEMRKALEAGRTVEVWIREAEWVTLSSGTRILVFADLERHLYKALKPAWNVGGLEGRGARVVTRKPAPKCREYPLAA